ncbi:MAG: hypothetical protein U1A78_04505 [Polyangia bacterium]
MADLQSRAGNAAMQMQSRSALANMPSTAMAGAGPAMRAGSAIPPGAVIERIDNANADAIYSALHTAGVQAAGGLASHLDWRQSTTAPLIEHALASMLAMRSIAINWDAPGKFPVKGCTFTGNITFRIGAATQVQGGGNTSMGGSTGGSGTVGSQNTSGTQTGVQGGGSVGGHEGAPGASGQVSGQDTSGSQQNSGGTVNSGGAMGGDRQMQRFQAPLTAEISLRANLTGSGWDVVNPFAWGQHLAAAALLGSGSGSAQVGTLFYYVSNGLAPSGQGH